MRKISTLLFVLLALCAFAFTANTQEEDPMDTYFNEMEAKYTAAADDKAKLELIKESLAKYPETDYTVMLIDLAKQHSVELDQVDDFVLLAEKIQNQVESPRMKNGIDRILLETFAEIKDIDRLNGMAEKLTGEGEKNFNLYYDLVRAFTVAEEWNPVLSYAQKGEQFATPEAYKKDYPDREMTDKELTSRGKNREGLLLTYAGWAKANTGRPIDALNDFGKAEKLIHYTYMDYSYGKLDYYWGLTLIQSGLLDDALNRLSPLAIFGEEEDAQQAMKETYTKKNGSDSNYDEFVKQQRMKFSKQIDDFSLADYDGNQVALSSFKGKVVVVSFWFPT
jgi:hypothetical protein